eukprot:TRINITY_DN9202_c2_g1_i1.p1 TRINITY_DN9202_c2_g1~~TRINITY_DN9202_c2_g1_i1.p1  ORF type:complete len:363 (+),score=75.97 TRINITY_DN9202_c2_g1_i1:64-1089(+)
MGATCCRHDSPEDKYEKSYSDKTFSLPETTAEIEPQPEAKVAQPEETPVAIPEAKKEPEVVQGEPVKEAAKAPPKEEEAEKGEAKEQEQELPFQDRKFKEFTTNVTLPEPTVSSVARRPSSTNITLEEYSKKYEHLFSNLLDMEKMDGWNLKKDEDGLQVYLKQEKGNHLMSFKAFTEMTLGKGGMATIILELLNTNRRVEWDEMCEFAVKAEAYVPYYGIGYVRLLPPAAIISKRDLCVLGRYKMLEDGGCLVALQSCEHPDHPIAEAQAQGYVRIDFTKGGYIVRPIPGTNKVKVCWTGCVDPKGWIPTWLANMTAWKQGLTLSKFKVHIAKMQEQEGN